MIDTLPTKAEYEKLIQTLKEGMTQLEPDGRLCVICEDSGHQAWECHHNPISLEYKATHYRCFHCGVIFTHSCLAEDHFGTPQKHEYPKCHPQIDHTFRHNMTVGYFNYLKNYLKADVPRDQLLEELHKLTRDIAYGINDSN